MGLVDPNPVLSWNLVSSDFKRKNIRQSAYQIIVSSSLERLNQNFGDLWDSEMIRSSNMSTIIYQGKGFRSSRKYWWKVRVWDDLNKTSQWSEPATFITGILRTSDWQAKWIGSPSSKANSLFRKEFEFTKSIKSAVLHMSSNSFFDIRVNANRLGDDVLLNGNAFFDQGLQYKSFDLTDQLWKGINTFAISCFKYPSTQRILFFAQLSVLFADGSVEIFSSDASWKISEGPVHTNSRGGEFLNANLVPKLWDKAFFFENSSWYNAVEYDLEMPVSTILPPFKIKRTLSVKDRARWNENTLIYDFGKLSLVLPALRIVGPKAGSVEITPMEDILIEEQNRQIDTLIPYSENNSANSISDFWHLQHAMRKSRIYPDSIHRIHIIKKLKSQKKWIYTLKGDDDELFSARFTPETARYLMVQVFPSSSDTILPKILDIEANVVEPGFDKLGTFFSSNENLDFKYDSITHLLDSWLVKSYIRKSRDSIVDWSDLIRFAGSMIYHKNYFPLLSEYLSVLSENILDSSNAITILKQSWMNYVYTANPSELNYYYPKLKHLAEHTELKLQADSTHKDISLVRLTELLYRCSNLIRNDVESSKWEHRNNMNRKLYGYTKADSLSNRFGKVYGSYLDLPIDSSKIREKLPEIYFSESAGIGVDDYGRGAGFKKIIIRPVFGDSVTQVSASYLSTSGYVSVSWKLLLNILSIDVSVPPNTQALLHIPTDIDRNFREKGIPNEQSLHVRHYGEIEGYTIYEIDSGNYGFRLTLPENNPYNQSDTKS